MSQKVWQAKEVQRISYEMGRVTLESLPRRIKEIDQH